MAKKIIVALLFLTMTGVQAFSQSKQEKEVADAVEALRSAMVNADKAALEKLTAEELSYGHSSGKVENKKDFVENIVNGKSDFVTIELSNQTVQVTGKTAIVRHAFSATTNDNGKPGSVKLLILLVWQKQKGGWKLLARQAVKTT
jgi:ketosteroid isomerase-like protein